MSSSLNSLGEAMEHMGNYDQAMGYFFQAIKIEEDTQNIEELSASYSFVATLYYLKKHEEALKYHKLALQVKISTGNKLGIAGSWFNFM